jgi:hypothetical protein
MMLITIALAALALAQQPSDAQKPELAVLKAGLGPCAADFTVKDADGSSVYGAIIHVRVRYGFMNIKRADLEVGTNSEGRARVEGLPDKAKPLVYEIAKDTRKMTVEQNVASMCQGTFDVTLKATTDAAAK